MILILPAGCALLGLAACVSDPEAAAGPKPLLTHAGNPCPEDVAKRRIDCRTKSEWRLANLAEDEDMRAQQRRDINALNTAAKPLPTPKHAKGF
jgi:hypothetical protein